MKKLYHKSKKLCLYCLNTTNNIRYLENAKKKAAGNIDERLDKFYKQVWDSHTQHKCFETGQKLYSFRKWHIHHVLEKKQYPEHKLNPDVCVLLTLEQHALWHTIAPSDRQKKMPNTWQKYLELLNKYNYG